VRVELVLIARLENCGITAGACQGNLHRLIEEFEALDLLNGGVCRFGLVEDDKGLALGLEVCLGHDVDHVSILREDCAQGLLERLGFDALFQITDVHAMNYPSVSRTRMQSGEPCMCRSAMTHT